MSLSTIKVLVSDEPPPPELAMVRLGYVPVIVTLLPAYNRGRILAVSLIFSFVASEARRLVFAVSSL